MTDTEMLAIDGGIPVRTTPFPTWPRPTEEMRAMLLDVLERDQWGIGSDVVRRLEKAFADFHHARYALSTNSGTAALWVALKAAGVSAGDEVIVPAYTFVATASSVLMANGIPVFVDIDPITLNLDPDAIKVAITDRTRAVIPVHIGGNPAAMDRILEVARSRGISVIEDAAQAHGAEWKGKRVGALGLGGIFSFQTSKNMAAGEGGIILSDSEEFINACFSYQNVGRVRGGQWYQHEHMGGNFRLSAFPAALLLAQLHTIESDMRLRDERAGFLDERLSSIEGITPQGTYPGASRHAHHLYIFRYERRSGRGVSLKEFVRALNAEGIPAYTGYTPLYRERLFITNAREYPWLKGRQYEHLRLPVTEQVADEEAVWLKQSCLLGSEQDVDDIFRAVKKVMEAKGK